MADGTTEQRRLRGETMPSSKCSNGKYSSQGTSKRVSLLFSSGSNIFSCLFIPLVTLGEYFDLCVDIDVLSATACPGVLCSCNNCIPLEETNRRLRVYDSFGDAMSASTSDLQGDATS